MKRIPPDTSPAVDRVSTRVTPDNEFSSRERWFVRGLIVLALAIIAAGLWQTFGRDVVLSARRWPMFRRVASLPSSASPVSGIETGATASRGASAHANLSQSASSSLTGLPATSRSFHERDSLNHGAAQAALETDRLNRPAALGAAGEAAAQQLLDQPLAAKNAAPLNPSARPNTPATPDKPREVETASVDLLQAAAQLVSLGWQDFAYPAMWLAAETSKPRMLYNSHRNGLLNAIAHPKPSALSLTQVRKDYTTARDQFHDDPRLDYAFGLALWHHGERSEALEVFQTAARLEGTPFLPAALAVGWGRLLNGDERRGLDQLSHVAKLLNTASATAASSTAYPTDPQREYAALCLGRAFGFLTGPGRTSELGEVADLTARNVRDRLPPDLLSEFEAGFDQVGQRQSDLLQFASLPENALATEHRQQTEEIKTRIDSLREEMKQTSQELARDHLSYLTTVTTFVTDILKTQAESAKAQPWVQKLKASIMQLAQPQPHAVMRSPTGALVPVNSNMGTTGSRTGRTSSLGSRASSSRATSQSDQNSRNTARVRPQIFLMPETPEERAARVAKLQQAQRELKRIQTELATLCERHRTLLDQRHQAEADQLAETKELRLAQADRRREQHALNGKLRELNTALRQMQSLYNSLDTVAAYVPWTVSVEGEALRQALTTRSASTAK